MNRVHHFVGLFAATAFAAGCGRTSPEQTQADSAEITVQLASVGRGNVVESLELVGNFLPRRRSVIVTDVDGRILRIPRSRQTIDIKVQGRYYKERLGLDLGQPVKANDVLVEIDPKEFELALLSAKAAWEKAKHDFAELKAWKRSEEIRRLRASRDEAKAALLLAQTRFNRTQEAYRQGAATATDLDERKAEVVSAKAMLDRAQADLEIAEKGPTKEQIAVADARVQQAAADVKVREDKLRRTKILAPYDGVITDRYVDEGDRVTSTPRVEIMEIMDLSLVVVQVGVPERYLHKIEMKEIVTVKAEGVREAVPGLVVLINRKVDPTSRTFRVRVAVENYHGKFNAGQFVRVQFPLQAASDALTVPTAAVTYEGGQPQVFVYRNGQVELRKVKLGLASSGKTEIVAGLKGDERVVTHDPSILSDGMHVRAETKESARLAEKPAP